MRIVAGEAKNHRIKSQKGHMVRPTLERVKESLFGILNPYINDAVFLDLFSGTGNIALEALSRGAKRAVMIEHNEEAVKIIIENVNSMGFEDKCRAYRNDAFRAVEILSNKREEFDIIFIDPPYKEELCTKAVEHVMKHGLLKANGLIVCEHYALESMPDEIGTLRKSDERKYGNTILTFYN